MWTGCLDLNPGPRRCASPSSEFLRFEDGFGAAFGVAPKNGTLEFADGDAVELLEPDGFDRSFYVVADNAKIRLRD